MKIINKIINSPLLHPILFAIFPILSLWAYNAPRMRSIEIIVPLLFSLVGFLSLFLVIRLFSKDWTKAGLLSSLAIVLFFSYGHVFGIVASLPGIIGAQLGRHRFLAPIWIGILGTGGYFILRYGKQAFKLNQLLNVVSAILVLSTCAQLFYGSYSEKNIALDQNLTAIQDKNAFDPSRVTDRKNLPDVYLIVLDMYARQDVLSQQMNIDNGPFLQELKDIGFVLPDCTMANYAQTVYAMSAYLNMNYINTFYKMNQKDAKADYPFLAEFIRHSLVRNNLTSLGYKTISFESSFGFVEIPDANIFYNRTSPQAVYEKVVSDSEFSDLLLSTTELKMIPSLEKVVPVVRTGGSLVERIRQGIYNRLKMLRQSTQANKYDEVMTALNDLETVPSLSGHKFVYLHLDSPHPPWVYGPDGEYSVEDQVPGYSDAVSYLDQRLPDILRKIIVESKVPPVIILQGDHGFEASAPYSRLLNLNAYYLPGAGKNLVYPTITPVNSFRVIFDAYFGGKYPMLDDKSYWLGTGDHTNLIEVPNTCVHN